MLGTTKTRCVFYKHTIRVCVSCSWRYPGTSAPSAPHLNMSLYLCSSGSNPRGESRALEGHSGDSSKSPSMVRDGDEGVAGRNKRRYFPNEGSLLHLFGPLIFECLQLPWWEMKRISLGLQRFENPAFRYFQFKISAIFHSQLLSKRVAYLGQTK